MQTPEGLVKKKVRNYLNERGAYFFFPVQTGIGASTVDILCCIDGYFVGIECKAEGKKLTPRQTLILRQIRDAGGIAIWGDHFEIIRERLVNDLYNKCMALQDD